MKIELVGGPKDGEQFNVPDNTRIWKVPIQNFDVSAFVEETLSPTEPIGFNTVFYRDSGKLKNKIHIFVPEGL